MNILKLEVNTDKPGNGVMIISNVKGEQVFSRAVMVGAGNSRLTMDVNKLAAGAYVVKMQLGEEVDLKKFTRL